MRNHTLTLSHPIASLELYELDPENWDWTNPPELVLVDDQMRVPPAPYMPHLRCVEVENRGDTELLADGRCKYNFTLTCKINGLWRAFFEKHCGQVDVQIEGDAVTLLCTPEEFQSSFDMICNGALYRATNDYATERDALVWLVFKKMKEQEDREHIEAEMRMELASLQQRQKQKVCTAQQNGLSVSFALQNFNARYRDVMDTKFNWWGKVLDAVTVTKYRTMFELALLSDVGS